ncbi:GntR family transcriptional regulator, partial [Mesorhizobium sp. M7A.F.Ca.CA.002.11.2.1]
MISTAASTSAEPAATRAYHVLEHMIVTLELAPASFVTEGALIDRLGLGRTPVREAIQRLAWEGLLDIRPRAGIAIAPLHPGDWLRVLDARRGVEVVLARSAARFVTREAADLFHEAALAMQKAVISGNVLAFIQADKALDEALALAADNPFAARLAAPLHTPSPRFRFRYK